MKKLILVLAAMLMATTSYNQTSRRSANSNDSAERSRSRTAQTRPNNNSSSTTRVSTNRTSSSRTVQVNNNSTNRNASVNRNTNNDRSTVNRNNTSNRVIAHDRDIHYTSNNKNSVNRNAHTHTHSHNRHSVNAHSTRTVYASSPSTRVYRGHHHATHVYHTQPRAKSYRVEHYSYRAPMHVDIVWTRDMHRNYIKMYPNCHHYEYSYGHRIKSVSAYHADYYIGEIKNVYGKVTEVYYARESDEYFLYVGPYYPYQDFTIVVPGYIARKYSHRPEYFFNRQYVNVTGLITTFEGNPEIVVKRSNQLEIY